ncbi:MAG TPA: DUF2169 domain-containing protein [Polyangium sp.]|nr:DUF2169 domain-containing protein [Polyangium sp.]
MELRSYCSLSTALLRFFPHEGHYAIAVICKATFKLAPTISNLSSEQEPIQYGESHYDNDPARGVERPNDMVPFKPRADVMLVGSAFAPGRQVARTVAARLVVGDIDKSVEVYGSRVLYPDGTTREGAAFASMPLRYEKASGGIDTWNPIGMPAQRDPAYGTRHLPQIMPKGFFLPHPDAPIPAIGFGPISASWPIRHEQLGARARTFSEQHIESQVLGAHFDPYFFQMAPRDQQIPALRPDERIMLENLHAEYPRLVTSLPGLTPAVFCGYQGHPATAVPLRADTLWIDTDRGICTVTFRGQLAVASFDYPYIFTVVLQEPGQTITWAEIAAKLPA